VFASASDLANYVGDVSQPDNVMVHNHINSVNPKQTGQTL